MPGNDQIEFLVRGHVLELKMKTRHGRISVFSLHGLAQAPGAWLYIRLDGNRVRHM